MNVKKKKWSTLKEMLFLYFALSKMFYWFNNIMQMQLGDFDAGIIQVFFFRFINQDFLLVFAILLFFLLERLKLHLIVQHLICYVSLLVAVLLQIWILERIYGPMQLDVGSGIGGYLAGIGYFGFFIYFTIGYFAIAVALFIKESFKGKAKEAKGTHETESENLVNDFSNAPICETCKEELKEKGNKL